MELTEHYFWVPFMECGDRVSQRHDSLRTYYMYVWWSVFGSGDGKRLGWMEEVCEGGHCGSDMTQP